MPKLDVFRRLASAMVKADVANRHVNAAWKLLVVPVGEDVDCPHPRSHFFPPLPLLSEGVVLFNFPQTELCVVCGMVLAAYPGVPHPMCEVGYGPLKK
jgi:hypothetical protein